MSKSKFWRRSDFALCALGIVLFFLDDILPLETTVSQTSHTYYRVVAAAGPEWHLALGGLLLLLGAFALIRSSTLKKNGA